jgi:hypothetical protein
MKSEPSILNVISKDMKFFHRRVSHQRLGVHSQCHLMMMSITKIDEQTIDKQHVNKHVRQQHAPEGMSL